MLEPLYQFAVLDQLFLLVMFCQLSFHGFLGRRQSHNVGKGAF